MHQLGHELSARFDIAHGASLSAVWGAWAKYVRPQKPERFAQFAKNVWGIEETDIDTAGLAAIKRTVAFFKSLDMPTCFSEAAEIGVKTEEELQQVIDRAKQVGAIVIIDEAYHYFYPNTFIEHALQDGNVVVLRTFSKLFSIAACRLGVIVSSPEIIHYVKNARLTFDANAIALLFAERILDHPELVEELIRIEKEGKAYTLEELRKKGYECRDCRGNFIFVKPRHDAKEITERLEKEKQVLVHAYGNELLKEYIRVSVGSKKAMQIFLDAFFEVDAE